MEIATLDMIAASDREISPLRDMPFARYALCEICLMQDMQDVPQRLQLW